MTRDSSDISNNEKEPVTLIVGDAAAWLSAGRSLPDDPSLHYVSFDEMSQRLLESFEPDIILTPLLGQGFDALDLAVILEQYKYKGRFRALCPKLPNPDLVMREIQSLCPSVDFDLFVVDDSDPRRLN
ncbi:hypothetical protein [Falsihalocynthiibacter arcticus]|uniref:hypothetical protein n=1 Tax=Falsihalocynthiibacter arcticus TaxID=1579316 RepID=UPI0012E7B559|nr:hypothetical protein [Falsihalocynthiibacter arcticus]